MASGGVDILQYITDATRQATAVISSSVQGSVSTAPMVMGGFGKIVSYIFAIIIVLLVLSLFIHFFITPIYRFHPGAPGIIPVPGFDDGVLFWNTSNVGQIKNTDTPIQNMSVGYSFFLDVFIENPMQFSKRPRVLFSRGAQLRDTPTSDTLLGIFENYNLAIALLPDTNDMIISILNKDNHMENVILNNVPVQEPFRLGVVLMDQALEVYLNGYLVKTRTFQSAPKDVKGDIFPASGIEMNMVKLRNLKIWPRLLTTAEIREAKPALTSASTFGAGPIPATSMGCTVPN